MFFVIPEMPSKTFVRFKRKKIPDPFKSELFSQVINSLTCVEVELRVTKDSEDMGDGCVKGYNKCSVSDPRKNITDPDPP